MRTNRGSVGAIDEEGDAVRARRNARATHADARPSCGTRRNFQANIVFCKRAAALDDHRARAAM
jgi:hypothetical protein